ncbi:MAG: glycosyltransferase, partial [Treponema sp.]|nr:glycosyltransferase [Treponema sp.]
PSFYEGFGMPPLEAMSLGTKAIISDIPVFKEIYKDFPVTFFKAGDCNDLAEKLLSIKNETDEIKEFPQIYSFEKTAEIIQKTLEESL